MSDTPITYLDLAKEVGAVVEQKNAAYGSAFDKAGEFFKLLYPEGIKPGHYADALVLVRMFDKMMRLATNPAAFDEDPWADLLGYALLGLKRKRDAATVTNEIPDPSNADLSVFVDGKEVFFWRDHTASGEYLMWFAHTGGGGYETHDLFLRQPEASDAKILLTDRVQLKDGQHFYSLLKGTTEKKRCPDPKCPCADDFFNGAGSL